MPICPSCATDNPERARYCLECGIRLGEDRPDRPESRRTVTVLFSDIVGSTALGEHLDPEALRIVLTRYFGLMEAVLERHGGSVEKFIGDAIMAVFGLRAIHEDDALRAVRAALEMRQALADLNIELEHERGVTIATRTGVHTGQVVAGDPSARQTLVTGDAVNTAARLEQAATAGEILVGETTWRLVRDAVDVERLPPVGAKGKAEPVPAVRLVGLRTGPGVGDGPPSAPLIGRDAELERLRGTFERMLTDRRAALVTVLGSAGVGKSRLVGEFLATIDGRARVLRGRCLAYGEGITYWPFREVLRHAAGIRDDDTPAEAARRLVDLLEGVRDGPLIAVRLAGAIGLSAEPAGGDEIFWAIRRTLEHLATQRPLVLVIEDIHWAESTLLELLAQVIELVREVPLLVLCPARTELLELHADWVGRTATVSIVLDGLPADAAAALLEALPGGGSIPPSLRARILTSAGGNPLFVQEIVGMLVDDGVLATGATPGVSEVDAETVEIPPTIQALMAARVDGLPSSERSVAQRASVVGRVFDEVEVVELTPSPARLEVTGALIGLVRRDLLEPERSELSVADAYKFRHVLIRDAAYEALRKTDRADLHERFADWLERAAGDRLMEFEAILGFHLEQAHRYRLELRETGRQVDRIGARAASHLHAAADAARDQGDAAAAVRLYRRALALPADDPTTRAALLLDDGLALFDLGRGDEAGARAEEALELASAHVDQRVSARARLLRLDVALIDGSIRTGDPALARTLRSVLEDAEASGDPIAQADAWRSIGSDSWAEARMDDSAAETRIALGFARTAGATRLALDIELNLLVGTFAGPTPAVEVVEAARELADRAGSYPTVRAEAGVILAVSEAMLGRFGAARAHVEESLVTLSDLAQFSLLVNARTYLAWTERLAGDLQAAETVLREAIDEAVAIGDRGAEGFVSCRLAETLVNQGRFDEAEAPLAIAERFPHAATETRILGAHARIRAARGDTAATDDVDRLLALVAAGPWLNVRAEANLDAAFALASLGSREAAERSAREALRLCHLKGNVALAGRIDGFIGQLAG